MAKRYTFVDLFRGWAVIFMIETHVVNAWMDAGLRNSSWFPYLNLLNGFVAPSFLFIAGVSFAMVTHMKWDEMSAWSPMLSKQIRRLLMILGIGYFLHFPRIEWNGLVPHFLDEDLAGFYQSDILHTIAVSLLILHALLLVIRSRVGFPWVVLVSASLALFFTPWLWQSDFSALHPLVANYLNGKTNHLFPLFPWCVFLFSGAWVGGAFLRMSDKNEEQKGMSMILAAGCAVFVIAFIGDRVPVTVFHYDNFWLTSPNWVLMRLGILLLLFWFFWFLDRKGLHTSPKVLTIGSQSLFAYVVHLWLIYSITGEKASLSIFNQDNSLWMTALLLTGLLVIVYYLTIAWGYFKKRLKMWRATIQEPKS